MIWNTTLSEGDLLPEFNFAAAHGETWASIGHRTVQSARSQHGESQLDGVPLVLILHRHLA